MMSKPDLERAFSAYLDSLLRIMWSIIDIFECLALPLYLRTETTRKDLLGRMWRYWGAWLWDEKFLFIAFRDYIDKGN